MGGVGVDNGVEKVNKRWPDDWAETYWTGLRIITLARSHTVFHPQMKRLPTALEVRCLSRSSLERPIESQLGFFPHASCFPVPEEHTSGMLMRREVSESDTKCSQNSTYSFQKPTPIMAPSKHRGSQIATNSSCDFSILKAMIPCSNGP